MLYYVLIFFKDGCRYATETGRGNIGYSKKKNPLAFENYSEAEKIKQEYNEKGYLAQIVCTKEEIKNHPY